MSASRWSRLSALTVLVMSEDLVLLRISRSVKSVVCCVWWVGQYMLMPVRAKTDH